MRPIIFHIDVNSAYLSWTAVEMLKNGATEDIREIEAIIGGDQQSRHGVVLAKSVPAKKYGIKTGEPVAYAFRKCPTLRTFRPDHRMYRRYSRQLMELLSEYTPDLEQLSIDECFMDFTGIAHRFPSSIEGALQIKDRIYRELGFTVNIGISSNKLLAKMASDFEKPNRVHTLFPEEIQVKMWPLPVGELYMAGRSSVEALKKLEIRTIGELAQTSPELLELHLKSHGRMLWNFANGIGSDAVISEEQDAKGIGNSTTLREDVVTEEEAKKVLLQLAQSVGKRLRKAGQKAGMVSVEIKYATFQSVSHQKQLQRPTQSDTVLYEEACSLFRELWDGEPIRLLGVRSAKLQKEEEPEQMTLFDLAVQKTVTSRQEKKDEELDRAKKLEKAKKLDQALDEIKKRFGESAVVRGTFLAEEQKYENRKKYEDETN